MKTKFAFVILLLVGMTSVSFASNGAKTDKEAGINMFDYSDANQVISNDVTNATSEEVYFDEIKPGAISDKVVKTCVCVASIVIDFGITEDKRFNRKYDPGLINKSSWIKIIAYKHITKSNYLVKLQTC